MTILFEIDDRDWRSRLLELLELDHEKLEVRALLAALADPLDLRYRQPVEPVDGWQLARLVHFCQLGQPIQRDAILGEVYVGNQVEIDAYRSTFS